MLLGGHGTFPVSATAALQGKDLEASKYLRNGGAPIEYQQPACYILVAETLVSSPPVGEP